MNILLGVYSVVLGLIVGSFLNVVLFRYGTGMGLGGRSRCISSGKTLRWYELVPVVSFLIQKGRSLHTQAKIPLQYPLVELVTGALFLFAFWYVFVFIDAFSFSGLLRYIILCIIFSYSVLVFVYDVKHMIIPHYFSYPLVLLSFLLLFFDYTSLTLVVPTLESILSGPLIALPFFVLWFVSHGRWIGFADGVIALAVGWFLGWRFGVIAVLFSFWVGALFGILVYFFYSFSKKKHKHIIPFGPFLLIGLAIGSLFLSGILDTGSFFFFLGV
jgi:leader peptidase (prepilin peptidase)/N-methyltransferase